MEKAGDHARCKDPMGGQKKTSHKIGLTSLGLEFYLPYSITTIDSLMRRLPALPGYHDNECFNILSSIQNPLHGFLVHIQLNLTIDF